MGLFSFGKKTNTTQTMVQKPVAPVVPATPLPQAAPTRPPSPTASFSQSVTRLTKGTVNIRDLIAPSLVEVDFDNVRINNRYYRTLFVAGYPRFVSSNWLHPI